MALNLEQLTNELVALSAEDYEWVIDTSAAHRSINRNNAAQPRTTEQKVQFRKDWDARVTG